MTSLNGPNGPAARPIRLAASCAAEAIGSVACALGVEDREEASKRPMAVALVARLQDLALEQPNEAERLADAVEAVVREVRSLG